MNRAPKIEHSDDFEASEFGVFWGESLFVGVPPKEPLIDHVLYERDVIFVSAQAGVGKSVLVMQMMASLTSGTPFLDSFEVSRPHNVLLLQTEGDRAETLRRIKCMEKAVKFDHSRWVHVNLDGICLNTTEGLNKFMALIDAPKLRYDIIIIDPLYTTIKGSMNDDEAVSDWVRNIRAVKQKFNCAFIVVHHESIKEMYVEGQRVSKGAKDLMGSSMWGAFGSYNFKLAGNVDKGFTFIRGKERSPNIIDNLSLRLVEPDPLFFVMAEDELNLSETQVFKLLGEVGKPLTAQEIIRLTKLSKATVYRVIRQLSKNDKIMKCSGENVVGYKIKEAQ